jgi:hypothetical protein
MYEAPMQTQIIAGTRVEFDSEHGPQKGTVIGVQKDISNGQAYAVVEVDHVLNGCTWQVPLNNLQHEAVSA